jgi:molybdopterin synthase sulfur carrier subunit
MAAVRIPPTLRADVGGARELEARGETVGDVIDDLVERYPALGAQLLEDGELASYVNVFIGGEDIRTRDGLETPVREGEHMILLPAMAGGASLTDLGSHRAEPGSAEV